MKISVITPTYNLIDAGRRETFLQMVDSVRSQTFDDVEHLIFDGTSTDGTLELLEDLQSRHMITKFVSEPDRGVYDAMNRGAGVATGDYIVFLNSDDYYNRADGLANIAAVLKTRWPDFVCSPVLMLSDPPHLLTVGKHFARALHKIPFGHPGMAVRRDTFHKFGGFDTSFKISADFDLMLRMIIAGTSHVVIEQPFVSFRVDGLSSNVEKRLDEEVRMMKKTFDRIMPLSEEEWRSALLTKVHPSRFLWSLIFARRMSPKMRLIGAYQLLRARRGRKRMAFAK